MGYDLPDANIAVANTMRNFLSADYLISPNKFHSDIYLKAYKLDGLYEGTIIEEGQPRSDMIYHADRDEVIDQLKHEGLQLIQIRRLSCMLQHGKEAILGNLS